MMDANYLGNDVEDLLSEALSDERELVQVVNPSPDTLESTVSALDYLDDPPGVHILAEERKVKTVMDDFLVASSTADLVESDVLALRVQSELPENALLVSANDLVTLVFAGEHVAGLVTDDDAIVKATYDHYEREWGDAEAFTLRTPALSRVRTTLQDDIGPETAADFDAVLESLSTARGDGEGLDEVTISLLVAAKNGELLYDISKWGEDIGLASKATF
ncbi:MAG: DUF5821 family protein, partial [Haloarculaceae archaeon]